MIKICNCILKCLISNAKSFKAAGKTASLKLMLRCKLSTTIQFFYTFIFPFIHLSFPFAEHSGDECKCPKSAATHMPAHGQTGAEKGAGGETLGGKNRLIIS